jgi:hypothetical protein
MSRPKLLTNLIRGDKNPILELMDRIADMEASPQADTAPKENPDKNPMLTNAPATGSETVVGVKKEDTENGRVDPTLAIFDDVDNNSEEEGPEFVDVDHVGFVDHNGVNCWVCPGLYTSKLSKFAIVDATQRL